MKLRRRHRFHGLQVEIGFGVLHGLSHVGRLHLGAPIVVSQQILQQRGGLRTDRPRDRGIAGDLSVKGSSDITGQVVAGKSGEQLIQRVGRDVRGRAGGNTRRDCFVQQFLVSPIPKACGQGDPGQQQHGDGGQRSHGGFPFGQSPGEFRRRVPPRQDRLALGKAFQVLRELTRVLVPIDFIRCHRFL